ncbi:MAG TPA: ABC transporter ATP-binding protein [Acidimicrobiales bacterium]|nr:ABC transporter ATP-binding protein [Acidimicrobiales bacterium]
MGRVAFDHVTKRFGDVTAVDDLTLDVADQEFLVLVGPSGCGKTTALRMLAGLDDPTSGDIVIGERVVTEVAAIDRDIAMVFQSYALYPHMSVRRNIEFPLRSRKVPADERNELVAEAAAALGLEQLLDRKPAQLSGGQRQRVALARAIVRRPEVFLMDEPLSNLDAKLRVQTRAELVELQRRLATTVVYVTHDQVEAMTMADRMAVMDQGILQQVGPPQEVYAKPANLFVARFIGNPPMNTITGTVFRTDGTLGVQLPGGRVTLPESVAAAVQAHDGDDVVVGVRPEHATLDPEGSIEATVAVVEVLGHEQHVICRLADDTLFTVRQPNDDVPPGLGVGLRIAVDSRRLHVFDPESGRRLEVAPAAPAEPAETTT